MDLLIHPPENEKKLLKTAFGQSDKKTTFENGMNASTFLKLVDEDHLKNTSVHALLEKCELQFYLPPPEPRNPELEERVNKLKAEQANAEYMSMTKHLQQPLQTNLSLREDIRSMSSQITAVINFVFAVLGSFFFAFKAVEYALPEPNIPAQVMIGVVTSTVVALADLFFLIRSTI